MECQCSEADRPRPAGLAKICKIMLDFANTYQEFSQTGQRFVSDDQAALQTKSQRLAIAAAIQHHLDAHGLARKDLIRDHLSKSTIDKLFQGEFSERTLTKIEAILNISLAPKHAEEDQAPSEVGGYTLQAVEYLQGDYLCVRPLFTDPVCLNAYLIRIAWDRPTRSLRFEELSRQDAKYAQKGSVYIPFGTPFLNLVSSHQGNLRTVVLSLPDREGICRGLITTLSNPKGTMYTPVAAPIFLRRLNAGEHPDVGFVKPESGSYLAYLDILTSVVADEYGRFVPAPAQADRRRTVAAVKP